MFSKLVSEYRINQNLTQDNIVHHLSMKYDEFKKLDSVTLSRWENGKTEPSLSKMFLYLKEFGLATNFFKSLIAEGKEFKFPLYEKNLNEHFSPIANFKMKALLGDSYPSSHSGIRIELCNYDELHDKYKKWLFHGNGETDNIYDNIKCLCVYLLDEVIGCSFFLCVDTQKHQSNELFFMGSPPSKANGVIFLFQVALVREAWELSFLFYFILHLNNDFYDAYNLVSTGTMYSLSIKLGFTYLDKININNVDYSIMSINTIRALSNSNMLGLAINICRKLNVDNNKILDYMYHHSDIIKWS
ncbi:helix-turn-helix domain-containing protein [Photobacterium damselae]|uniref:XRE family transcriptional regulator n=1 Tax=Photobacterium damselae TaxID=38293 RepID=A0ABD6XCG3_PHODM|nr:helix-turn-helix transcriptional regulator [Photobacterium damselae]OBU43835.1 hypothetical protein AYY27_04375 [Photobacterium damselae]PSU18723.1 XRE family transcriptional regulator [Photobacterium damselae]